jgi:hypothetical protein
LGCAVDIEACVSMGSLVPVKVPVKSTCVKWLCTF